MRDVAKNTELQIRVISIFLLNIFTIIESLNQLFLRTLIGIPFILFIPGYSLITALFIKKNELDDIERLALNFGQSIAIVPLIALLYKEKTSPHLIETFIYG